MMPIKTPVCVIEKQMRDNYLALFVEMVSASELGTVELRVWMKENDFLIRQSITELETLDIEYI